MHEPAKRGALLPQRGRGKHTLTISLITQITPVIPLLGPSLSSAVIVASLLFVLALKPAEHLQLAKLELHFYLSALSQEPVQITCLLRLSRHPEWKFPV